MAKFTVLQRIDAWIDYVAEVEAEDAEAAAKAAHAGTDTSWKRVGEAEFWNARFTTLDDAGNEISDTTISRG